MIKIAEPYNDLAIVIAWPEQTARGDEAWMALLKKIGIVKNLNFKVGHAAIILIHRLSGSLNYYDFGRYISPRGFGRARSAYTDPRLQLFTRAHIATGNYIVNLPEILAELQHMEKSTHGGGRLYFSIAADLSFSIAKEFADGIVNQGPVKYGALAYGNNSCSRFVAQVLAAAYRPGHKARKDIRYPETLKPSPLSNVVNAAVNRQVYCYATGKLTEMTMTRFQSLRLQIQLLGDNLSTIRAAKLPSDAHAGFLTEPQKPIQVPVHAQWLGGIGEGAWFALQAQTAAIYVVVRYDAKGDIQYTALCVASGTIDVSLPYRFTYHCHYQMHYIEQGGEQFILNLCTASFIDSSQKLIKKEA